jgi:UDP-glucose 4-epimerase
VKVVITGGAGFIGGNLAAELAETPSVDEVVVLDDLSTGDPRNLEGLDVRLVAASILERDALDEVCSGAGAIVHLAARPSVPRSLRDPLASHHANATGTLEVLEAARRAGGPHVIVASSSSVYGANPTLPKSEDLRTEPLSPYAVSKLATESYAIAYGHCFSLPVLPLRFFNVFGPLQRAGHAYAAVIPTFLDAAMHGRPLPIHGDGSQTRDFTFVGSVVAVLAAAVVRGVVSREPVNLAFGTRRTLLEVVDAMEAELGRSLPREHHEPREGDVRHSQADGRRLRSLFPDLSPTAFEEGLASTIAWFEGAVAAPSG